jgi:hypothetical protein
VKSEPMLVDYIEKWFRSGPRRNIQKLSRMTGVPYPTIRRIMQKDSLPSVETAFAILNVIATVPETLAYFASIDSISRFFKRYSDYSHVSQRDFKSHIVDRESFWIIMMGFTIGATRLRVKELLGSLGLAALERLIEDGAMIERSSDTFVPRTDEKYIFVEEKKLAVEVVDYISDLPGDDTSLQRFLVCNVNEEGFEAMRQVLRDAYERCRIIANEAEGPHLVAFSFVGKSVIKKNFH